MYVCTGWMCLYIIAAKLNAKTSKLRCWPKTGYTVTICLSVNTVSYGVTYCQNRDALQNFNTLAVR